MKILVVNSVPTEKNGITNVIFNYLSAMNSKEIVFDYIAINYPDKIYKDIIHSTGGQVYVLKRSYKSFFPYVRELCRIIKNNAYDAVHIHGNSHTVVLDLLAAWLAGCKVRIVHAHSTKCNSIFVHKVFSLPFNLLCTHRVACGKAVGEFMFGDKAFVVLNNGVDTDRFVFNVETRDRIREKLGWSNKKIIGHVGYFLPIKNQSFVIDVFECLYQQNPDYRLVLIGDGPMKEEIQLKLNSKQLGDVSFLTGNIDNVDEYLNAIDVIVMPSLYEGLPLTLIEQQANGLVCVVSDRITREADKSGNLKFVSLRASVEKWAKAVMDDDGLNREERSIMAIDRIVAAGYSIKVQSERLNDFYKSIIDN